LVIFTFTDLYWLVLAAIGPGGIAVSGVRAPAPLSGGLSESGTVVPHSKTLRAEGGLAFCRRPPFASLVLICHFDLHAPIMADHGAGRKPTVLLRK
jgi:hypothetical protein